MPAEQDPSRFKAIKQIAKEKVAIGKIAGFSMGVSLGLVGISGCGEAVTESQPSKGNGIEKKLQIARQVNLPNRQKDRAQQLCLNLRALEL